ncbi:hypothetical protein JCM10207_004796 [Rhodosporidiobolus poonsookiae]
MTSQAQPNEPPPAYSASAQDHLSVPTATSGGGHRRTDSAASASDATTSDAGASGEGESVIPVEDRRTMMDEARPLPQGWRREFDPNSQHYFYVDTNATPPRSIWTHPLDDPDYLSAHPKEAQELASSFSPPVEPPSDSKHPDAHAVGKGEDLSPAPSRDHVSAYEGKGKGKEKEEKRTLGRRMKDKLTGTTHEQRVAERKRRQEAELKQYQAYLQRRQQILEAQASGRYQPMYAAPAGPYRYQRPMYGSYGYGPGYGPGGYGNGIGMMRPSGLGTGMAVGGGLLGGLLLGDMLF